MRGSLRIDFQLNSFHLFLGCIFRLQDFFKIIMSSDVTHVPNLSLPLDAVDNGENCLSISFFIFEEQGSKHRGTLKQL